MFPGRFSCCGSVLSLCCSILISGYAGAPCVAQSRNAVAVLGVFNATQDATGQMVSGPTTGRLYYQSSRSDFGASVQYDHWWGKNGLLVAYARTPTDATLIAGIPQTLQWGVPSRDNALTFSSNGQDVKWDLVRNEFNVLYARRFLRPSRISPHLLGGVTAVLLNGGRPSGWDHQFAPAVGAGSDFRLNSRLSFRCMFLASFLRASNYSDSTYMGGRTIMFESRFGPVFTFGSRPTTPSR